MACADTLAYYAIELSIVGPWKKCVIQ